MFGGSNEMAVQTEDAEQGESPGDVIQEPPSDADIVKRLTPAQLQQVGVALTSSGESPADVTRGKPRVTSYRNSPLTLI